MSRNAQVTFGWADGDHIFRLGIKELEELQEKTDCGPLFLLNRITRGEWRVADLRDTIRLGLIGGGLDPFKAIELVKRYVDDRPLSESVRPAQAILAAAILGPADGEKPGKARAAKAKAPSLPTESSPLPPSTEPAQS